MPSHFPGSHRRRPLLLDLFCGAGGAADGYHAAGFDIVGVDVSPQPHYPYPFLQGDALAVESWAWPSPSGYSFPEGFAAVHASPPCQRYSDLAKRNGNADAHPDLIEPVRAMLQRIGLPYVIENVEGAPLIDPIVLCGAAMRTINHVKLRVIRHRLFESNVPLTAPPHVAHPLCYTRDKRKAHYGRLNEWTDFVSVNGGGNCSVAAALDAMGVYRPMTKAEINEAVPPEYTRYVGEQLVAALGLYGQGVSPASVAT